MDDLKTAQRALAVDFKNPPSDQAQSLARKTILVTGGASGFGESIIKEFLKQPDTAAIIADLNDSKGGEFETSLREAGYKAKYIRVDVTNWDSVISLFRGTLIWLRDTFGPDRAAIDHIVCSAGLPSQALDTTPLHPDEFLNDDYACSPPSSRSINVSVVGSLHTVSAAMKFAMSLHKPDDKRDRSITLFASLAGYTGISHKSDYTASKWGVRGLFRSLLDDKESATCPVRVNLVAPTFVETPLTAHHVPLLRRLGIKFADIEDVRDAALRLMGDRSIHGRAAGVWQGGPVDLCDDQAGGFGEAALAGGVDSGAMKVPTTQVSKQRERA